MSLSMENHHRQSSILLPVFWCSLCLECIRLALSREYFPWVYPFYSLCLIDLPGISYLYLNGSMTLIPSPVHVKHLDYLFPHFETYWRKRSCWISWPVFNWYAFHYLFRTLYPWTRCLCPQSSYLTLKLYWGCQYLMCHYFPFSLPNGHSHKMTIACGWLIVSLDSSFMLLCLCYLIWEKDPAMKLIQRLQKRMSYSICSSASPIQCIFSMPECRLLSSFQLKTAFPPNRSKVRRRCTFLNDRFS